MVDAINGLQPPIVVVGHSSGSATISLVPDRTRVDRLIYVTAFVLEPGRSIVDIAGVDVRDTILSISRDDGNGCRSCESTQQGLACETIQHLPLEPTPDRQAVDRRQVHATLGPGRLGSQPHPLPEQGRPAAPRTARPTERRNRDGR